MNCFSRSVSHFACGGTKYVIRRLICRNLQSKPTVRKKKEDCYSNQNRGNALSNEHPIEN